MEAATVFTCRAGMWFREQRKELTLETHQGPRYRQTYRAAGPILSQRQGQSLCPVPSQPLLELARVTG